MKIQNYENHRRLLLGYHGVTFLLIVSIIGGSINFMLSDWRNSGYSSSMFLVVGIVLLFLSGYSRTFGLKAQDRAIKAEENLRYYTLTKKLLPRELAVSKIVALRFAEDDEFVALVDRAVKENLSSKEIKQSIKNWRADWYRV